jgi:hypothetical protein
MDGGFEKNVWIFMTGGNDGILEMCKSDELMTDE